MPKPEPSPLQLPPPSKRTTSVRIASARSTNVGQSRLRSRASIIVRDLDGQDEPTTEPKPDTIKIPRLGRPTPRALTKSLRASRSNKGVSKCVKISEAVIPGEPDHGSFHVATEPVAAERHLTIPPPANPKISPPVSQTVPVVHSPSQDLENIHEYMHNIVIPLVI